jgi:hypothetical protein
MLNTAIESSSGFLLVSRRFLVGISVRRITLDEISSIPQALQATALYISLPHHTGVHRVTFSGSSNSLIEIITLIFLWLINITLIYTAGAGTLSSSTRFRPSEIYDGLYWPVSKTLI